MSLLQTLLEQDGVHLPEGGGAEKEILCFSPAHDDKTPSMSINVAKDLYLCHGCGIRGGPYKYLVEIRGMGKKEAMETLERMGAPQSYVQANVQQAKTEASRNKRLPAVVPKIPDEARASKAKNAPMVPKVAEYLYTNEIGDPLFVVARHEWDDIEKRKKTFRQYTRRKQKDGWWACGPTSDMLPPNERLRLRPLFNVWEACARNRRSIEEKQKPVQTWVVEGEKCVSLVRQATKKITVVSPCGGSGQAVEATDWSPLYGGKALIIADADEPGRKFAKAIANHLHANKCAVRMVLPPGEDGYDVADAIGLGGFEAVLEFIEKSGGVKSFEEAMPADEINVNKPIPPAKFSETPYFKIMGMIGDKVCIQSKATHKIYRFTSGALMGEGNMLQIAPQAYWDSIAGSSNWTAKQKRAWVDAMLRAAERGGELDLNNTIFWRRGARVWRDSAGEEHFMFHAGNRLLFEGNDGRLTEKRSLSDPIDNEIYLPGPAIDVVDGAEAARYALEFCEAVLGYRWIEPTHGHILLGWICTSLIGGALRFRPAVWLTAAAGTGKSYVLDAILKPAFGSLVMPLANATEAGLAALSTDSALPALLDEFEPEKGKEAAQQGILNLLRIATSGDAARVRGTSDGGVVSTRPRFSLFMSSIDRPMLSDANEQRIMPIRLSPVGVDNWLEVEAAIEKATTPERCLALRSHIILNTATIAKRARAIEKEYVRMGISTREAQIRGALSAGVSFLLGESGFRLGSVREQASDKYGPLASILAARVRLPPHQEISLAEALQRGFKAESTPDMYAGHSPFDEDSPAQNRQQWADLCRRYGVMLKDDHLVLAEKHPEHRRLLRDSYWQSIDLDEYVRNLEGSFRARTTTGQPQRLRFGPALYRSSLVPRYTVESAGFHIF